MGIQINDLSHMQPQGAGDGGQVKVSRDEPNVAQQETGKPSTGDTVSLTDTAQQLRKLENTLSELPVVDSQRVEDIRAAIANGSYEVDPTRVAEKLINFDSQLR
jgi:negative regulator of flagellin synthesis FlgM